ncbi:transporter substrate-binding domain-containing protein [Paucibacter sp. AS339]|uniref:substrate-binding periplasmic protein n=1 Tax=Paucibacter hankyongi TaxID=3133434 RepID=UPI0030B28F56
MGSADPPYRIFGPGSPRGLYFDLMTEAARRLGWRLSFTEVPSARAFKMMEQGDADVMLGPLMTADRMRFLRYCEVQLPSEDKAFYALPLAAPVHSLSDLDGRSIAVHRGKRYGSAFDERSGPLRQEVNDYRVALEMVVRGRLELAIVPERQGDLLLRQHDFHLLKQPLRLAGEPPYVVVSLRSPWLSQQPELERTFKLMREDGSWQRIVRTYL